MNQSISQTFVSLLRESCRNLHKQINITKYFWIWWTVCQKSVAS